MRARRAILAVAFATLFPLVIASAAGAAAWLPPGSISDPSASAGDAPSISFGASGDAAAAWWSDSGGGLVMLARKRAGGAWGAPVPAAASANVNAFVGVDGAGNVTAVWSSGGGASVTTIATWPAGAAAPTLTTLDTSTLDQPDPVTVNSLAVNAAGDAVMAGSTALSPSTVVLGYRHGAGGSFAFGQKFGSGLTLVTPLVAINAAGNAVASWRTSGTGLWGSMRTADTDWGAPEAILGGVDGADHSVAIDAAGLVYVAYTLGQNVGAALRSLAGIWQPSAALSPSGFTASNVSVVVTPTGAALLAWKQSAAVPLDATIQTRSGSTTTNIWGAAVPLSDAASANPVAAIGNDGRAVVAWQRIGFGDSTEESRVRAPDGTWGGEQTVTPQIVSTALLSIGSDGRGHFATASTRLDGTKRVVVTSYDAAPPSVTPIALSGTATAGGTLNFSVTATDEWSPLAGATWTFGDGATASGLAASHVYLDAGIYGASVAVSDAAGNVTTLQLPISVAVLQATLTARISAKWSQSRVKGTLVVKGTVPRAGTYAVDVTKGKARKIHASFKLEVGAFSKTIKLPAKLVPGSYHVALLPSFPATQVTPAGRDVKLATPASGVVDGVVLSGKLNGPATGTLRNQNTLYVRFHFAAVPKRSKLLVTWYLTIKGKRTSLGSASKSPAVKVGSYVLLGGRRGKVTAVISRKGIVIAQASVNVL